MSVATCPNSAELSSLLLGQLPAAAAEGLERHVETCQTCQDTVKSLRPGGDWLADGIKRVADQRTSLEPGCQEAIERIRKFAPEATAVTMAAAEKTTGPKPVAPPDDGASNQENLGTIREYKLLAKLGQGGMGAVYKAQHTKLRRTVALKVLPAAVANSPAVISRFEREMQAVGALDHPNIVRAFDAGESDGRHYLVMEYVKGRDLSEVARVAPQLSIADACELVRQAAVGLQHAHEAGLVHRDIKPSNLMLSETGVVKILDLGLALLHNTDGSGELTSTGQVMGTIDYMAPEQGGDTHHVDIRADIYSLGATLYRLLAGIAPFGEAKYDTPVKKLMALATQEPTPVKVRRPEIPPALATIVGKMLAKAPDKRYATPAEVATALAPFCASANLAALAAADPAQQAAFGEAPTQPTLKSASVETISRARQRPADASHPWRRFQALPAYVRWIALTLLGLVGGGGLAWAVSGIVLQWQTPHGTVRIEILDDKIQAQFDKDGLTITGADKEPIKVVPAETKAKTGEKSLPAGAHKLVITRGDFSFTTNDFELTKDGKTTIKIELVADKIVATANGKPLGAARLDSLAGEWTSGGELRQSDFGTIQLTDQGDEYRGTYTATYDKQLGEIKLKPLGERKFEGTWGESNQKRRGSLKAELSPDGNALRVDWEAADPENTQTASAAKRGVSEWKRIARIQADNGSSGGKGAASKLVVTPPLALYFDGDQSRGELPVPFEGDGDFTLELWTVVESFSNYGTLLGAPDVRLRLTYLTANNLQPTMTGILTLRDDQERQGQLSKVDGGGIRLGEPMHVAFVRQDGKTELYVNGRARSYRAGWGEYPNLGRLWDTRFAVNVKDWTLGQFRANKFTGWLGEVRISDVARYQRDFVPAVRFETDEHTLGLYHCDEGAGNVLKDSSGKNRHGKIEGTKWLKADVSPPPANALEFDGDDFVEIPGFRFDGTHPFTFEAKLTDHLRQPETSSPIFNSICDKDGFPYDCKIRLVNYKVDLSKQSNEIHVSSGSSETNSIFKAVGRPRSNAPIDLAAVFNDNKWRIYVNGKHVTESKFLYPAGTYKSLGSFARIGGWVGQDPGQRTGFVGVVGPIRISRSARYNSDYTPPTRFEADQDTAVLYQLDEGQGDVLNDSSGNNHHGKIVGAKWIIGRVADIEQSGGSALDFSDPLPTGSSHVQLPLKLRTDQPLTVEMFVTAKEAAPKGQSRGLFAYGGKSNLNWLTQYEDNWNWAASSPNANDGVYGKLVPNHRTHLAAIRTETHLHLYIDGKLARSTEVRAAGGELTPECLIGGLSANAPNTAPFVGAIDGVRITDGARYDKNFAPPIRFEKDDKTLALYNFGEGRGKVLNDSSGNNHHGRIVEAKWVVAETGSAPGSSDQGFVRMFNDKDLTGWDALRSGSIQWTNEGGLITGRNRSGDPNSAGVLQSKQQYKDFHFRCELLAGAASEPALLFRNVGKLIRGSRHGYAIANPAPASPIIAEGWGYGSLYADDFQVFLSQSRLAPSIEKDLGIKTGDWYRLEIIAQGETVEVRINGKRTAIYTSSDPALNRSGAFAIRCGAGATVALRNLEIKELRPVELEGTDDPAVSPTTSSESSEDAAATPGAQVARKANLYTVKPYWSVKGGELLFGSNEFSHQWIFFGDKKWTDYDFQAQVLRLRKGSPSGGVSLLFRSAGPNFVNTGLFGFGSKGIGISFNRGGKEFFSHEVDGVSVPSHTEPGDKLVNNRWYTLKVEVRGSTVRSFLDGRPVVTFDKVPFAKGKVGLHVNSATYRIRDIQVTAPDGSSLWSGPPDMPPSPLPVPAEYAALSDDSPSQSKTALLFDDRTDAVDFPGITFDGSDEFTIEGWFKNPELAHCEYFNFEPGGPTMFAMPRGKLGEIAAACEDKNGKRIGAVCIDKLRVGELQHLALTYRRQRMMTFVDGVPIAESEVIEGPLQARRLRIANTVMELHQLRVSRVSRYSQPFNPERNLPVDDKTIALYRCDDGQGDVLKDSSGNNHHGKIAGARWTSAPATIDLLRGVEFDNASASKLKWRREGHRLVATGVATDSKPDWDGMIFPSKFGGDYDAEIDFKQSGFVPLQIDFPLGDRAIRVSLTGGGGGLMKIDDKDANQQSPPLSNPDVKMRNNVTQTLIAKVRQRGNEVDVVVTLDGVQVGHFSGLRNRITLPAWVKPNVDRVSFAGRGDFSKTQIEFSRAVVKLVKPLLGQQPPPAIAPFDAAQAKAHQEAWAKHLGVPVEYTNSIGMKFMLIPPGEFMRGSATGEAVAVAAGAKDNQAWREQIQSEQPAHRVVLTEPMYLGITEVTQKQYQQVVAKNPAEHTSGKKRKPLGNTDEYPVETLTWEEADDFCRRLSKVEQLPITADSHDRSAYHLPSEAEWEFACRAGTTTRYYSGERDDELAAYAWTNDNSDWRPHAVASKKPNAFGLFDVHGNVWEYVADHWDEKAYVAFADKAAVNPLCKVDKTHAVRGGSWHNPPASARSASRSPVGDPFRHGYVGFRAALSVAAIKAKLQPPPAAAVAPINAALGKASEEASVKHLGVPVEHTNPIGMKFQLVPHGKSWLGGGAGQPGSRAIEFKEDFYLGAFTVTQEEWQKVMGSNPTHFSRNGARKDAIKDISDADLARFPVEGVSYAEVEAFLAKLNALDRQEGWEYRLPTSDEWEYACRGGPLVDQAESAFSFYAGEPANDLPTDRANFGHKEGTNRTVKVGQFAPNKLGLYDLHGNVLEWCSDVGRDELGRATHLARGGSWNDPPGAAASHTQFVPTVQYASLGVRVVRARVLPRAVAPFDATQAKLHQETWAKRLGLPVEYTNSIGMKLRLIPPGEFMMGSTPEQIEAALKAVPAPRWGEEWRDLVRSEGPQHQAVLTKPYYLGIHEVTQSQYEQVMTKNPSVFSPQGSASKLAEGLDTKNFPVDSVSWKDALEFCAKLAQREQLPPHYARDDSRVQNLGGIGYRLPTETEWEFACRAGTTTFFCTGDTQEALKKVAWCWPFASRPHAVGELNANAFGLFDMHGNVWEWVQDRWRQEYYANFKDAAAIDPTGPSELGGKRVIRGGTNALASNFVRSANRAAVPGEDVGGDRGFRVALSIEAVRSALERPQTVEK